MQKLNMKHDSLFSKVGDNLRLKVDDHSIGNKVEIGDRCTIECAKLVICDNVVIGNDVHIMGDNIIIGHNTVVEDRVVIRRKQCIVEIGDAVYIGNDSKFTAPIMLVGDYCTINNHCMISGNEPITIGHNAWIGQNCVLNSQQRLTIGNNFGLGMYSCIYTHGYFGELLEGCNVYKEEEVVIGNDVWILGQFNMISPGVNLGSKSLVLNGSNVTKNVSNNRTIGGHPIKDLTDKLVPYRDVSLSEKFEMMEGFILEWLTKNYSTQFEINGREISIDGIGKILMTDSENLKIPEDTVLIFTTSKKHLRNCPDNISVFDLSTKRYKKTRTVIEIDFIRFMKSYRARFVPEDRPEIKYP